MTASSAALRAGLERAQWRSIDLWRATLGMGGDFTRHDIELFLNGKRSATRAEHDILASTFNDHFLDRNEDHPVRYWRELVPSTRSEASTHPNW